MKITEAQKYADKLFGNGYVYYDVDNKEFQVGLEKKNEVQILGRGKSWKTALIKARDNAKEWGIIETPTV